MSATRTSVADALSQIGGDRAKLFHTAAGETYGTVDVDGHKEHHRISSAGFQRWLSLTFWRETHMAPPPEAMRQALNLLDARAIHDGEQHEVHMRVAPHPGGGVALDLCDREWRAVVVDANGWKITNDPPVRFRRADGMLALQDPVRGGSIEDLRPYFSAADGADDEIFALALGSLLCAFRPKGPYPITAYIGEHGSLKSTRQRMARQLIDPSKSDLRAAPRNERDLAISAENGWIASFDNVSRLSEAISDALCRLATGGGFSTRELYSDDRERIFDAARPVVLNSIESVITRGDLADRAITIMLPRVEKYRPSDEVWAEFERDRPRLLGALLDAVVVAIQNESATSIDPSIRMADAARWVAAAEPALPFENGTWLAAYAGVREDGHRITVESSVIGSSVLRLLATSRSWSGTATDLLAVLAEIAGEAATRRRLWPANARVLSGELRRLSPALRALGYKVEMVRGKGRSRDRTITLEAPGDSGADLRPDRPDRPHNGAEDARERFADAADAKDAKIRPAEGAEMPPVGSEPW